MLLKMAEIIARNMLSWLELLINCYCCIWLVVHVICISDVRSSKYQIYYLLKHPDKLHSRKWCVYHVSSLTLITRNDSRQYNSLEKDLSSRSIVMALGSTTLRWTVHAECVKRRKLYINFHSKNLHGWNLYENPRVDVMILNK